MKKRSRWKFMGLIISLTAGAAFGIDLAQSSMAPPFSDETYSHALDYFSWFAQASDELSLTEVPSSFFAVMAMLEWVAFLKICPAYLLVYLAQPTIFVPEPARIWENAEIAKVLKTCTVVPEQKFHQTCASHAGSTVSHTILTRVWAGCSGALGRHRALMKGLFD